MNNSSWSEEQKSAYVDYGVVPGPVHNNFGVCDKECYVATFEYYDKASKRESVVDVYMVTISSEFGQTILYREDSEWEGSYGSLNFTTFLKSLHFDFYKHLLCVLLHKGAINWERKQEKPA